jgi:FkbM family methyltransferase
MSLAKISTVIVDQFYFARSPLSKKLKAKLFSNYVRLSFKRLFLRKAHNEHFLGLKFYSKDYRATCSLYSLIFYRSQYMFNTANKNPLIIDCGANIGTATLFFKWIYKNAEIHCFEPNPDICNILKKNVSQNNFDKVFVNESPVGNKDGFLTLYIDEHNKSGLTSSLKSDFGKNQASKKINVKVIKLSKYIKTVLKNRTIDMIKFNIEGMENDVIEDLYESKMLKNVNNMMFEYHHLQSKKDHAELGSFLQKLEEYGFDYNFSVNNFGLYEKFNPQNIFIYAYKIKQ